MSAERSEAILAQLETYLRESRDGCMSDPASNAYDDALEKLRELRAAYTCEYELGAGWHCARGCEKNGR